MTAGGAMSWTRELHADFVHINTMLDVLEAALIRLDQHRYVDSEMLRGIFRFFREFVHGCHELKAELVMLPLITRKGTTAEIESIPLLRCQYQSMDALLRKISCLIAQPFDAQADVNALNSIARRYVNDSRRHFSREQSLLEGFAARALTADEDEAFVTAFARLERDRIGPTGREFYTQVILDYRDIVSTWPGADWRSAGGQPR